jgi:acetyl esterase/lipase
MVVSMNASLASRLQMAQAKWTGRAISRLMDASHHVSMVPGDDRVDVIRNVGNGGRDPRHAVDLYLPRRRSAAPLPFLAFVHGGGYIVGDRRMCAPLGRILAARGVAVVAPGYRLQPETDLQGQLEDVRRALGAILPRARRDFGLDPERYVLGGESAGAHLSLRTLQDFPATLPAPRGWVGLYGFYDMAPLRRGVPRTMRLIVEALRRGRSFDEAARDHTALRPLSLRVPLLVQHGEADQIIDVEQSRLLAAYLRAYGHPVRLHTYADAGHGFIYHPGARQRAQTGSALRTLYGFVRRCTGWSMDARVSAASGEARL